MKQNQKFNQKLIYLGSLLLVITFAFIFASGCIVDNDNSYIQPSNMAEVISQQIANAESQGQILEIVPVPVPDGIVKPINEYGT